MDLTGRRVLVTGASSGIGEATCRALGGLDAVIAVAGQNLQGSIHTGSPQVWREHPEVADEVVGPTECTFVVNQDFKALPEIDPGPIVQSTLRQLQAHVDRPMRLIDRLGHDPFVHLHYAELVHDPIGKHTYSLDEFGLTAADLEPLYEEYLSAVDVALEPARSAR